MNDVELTKVYSHIIDISRSIFMSLLQKREFSNVEYELEFTQKIYFENEEAPNIEYPIPVIQVGNLMDIEIWLEHIIISSRMDLKDVMKFDFSYFSNYQMYLFGVSSCNYYFYDNQNPLPNLEAKLNELKEQDEYEAGIELRLPLDTKPEEIMKIIRKLRSLEIMHYRMPKKRRR